MKSKYWFLAVVSLSLSLSFSSPSVQSESLYNGGYIPSAWQINWRNAGLLSQTYSINRVFDVTQINKPTLMEKINCAIDSARQRNIKGLSNNRKLTAIYFPEGTYNFIGTPISLIANDSNIVFIGDGSDKTILHLEPLNGNTNDYNRFDFRGYSESNSTALSSDLSKGSDGLIFSSGGLNLFSFYYFSIDK